MRRQKCIEPYHALCSAFTTRCRRSVRRHLLRPIRQVPVDLGLGEARSHRGARTATPVWQPRLLLLRKFCHLSSPDQQRSALRRIGIGTPRAPPQPAGEPAQCGSGEKLPQGAPWRPVYGALCRKSVNCVTPAAPRCRRGAAAGGSRSCCRIGAEKLYRWPPRYALRH